MKALLQDLLPHAPQFGLYVAPQIPPEKVRNAVKDYARAVREEEVIALYDATLMGSGKDGAVFLADRLVYQNSDLEPAQEIRYADVVRIETKRKLLGGREILLDVNRGRATVSHRMDFSGKTEAAEYVARFLHEAMLHGAEPDARAQADAAPSGTAPSGAETDAAQVRAALDDLRARGALSEIDHRRLLRALLEG